MNTQYYQAIKLEPPSSITPTARGSFFAFFESVCSDFVNQNVQIWRISPYIPYFPSFPMGQNMWSKSENQHEKPHKNIAVAAQGFTKSGSNLHRKSQD